MTNIFDMPVLTDEKKEMIAKKAIEMLEKDYSKRMSYSKRILLWLKLQKFIQTGKSGGFMDRFKKEEGMHPFQLKEFLGEYTGYRTMYSKLNKFFVETNRLMRDRVLKSSKLKAMLTDIAKRSGLEPKKHMKLMIECYKYTLNQYVKDPTGWGGFWSLITLEDNGKIKGVYLGDTADREYFWGYFEKKRPELYQKCRKYWKENGY